MTLNLTKNQDIEKDNIKGINWFLVVGLYLFGVLFFLSHTFFIEGDKVVVIMVTLVTFLLTTIMVLCNIFMKNQNLMKYINVLILIIIYSAMDYFMPFSGGITIWAMIFVLMAISLLYRSKVVIIMIHSIAIFSAVYYMITASSIVYQFGRVDYYLRIIIILFTTTIVLMVNNRNRKKLVQHYQYVEEHVELNEALINSEIELKNQQTNLIILREKVDDLAFRDTITQLSNKNALLRAFPIGTTFEDDGGLRAFAYFDIDHFKQINDAHSHQVGDEFLLAIARTIQSVMENFNYQLYRVGGDEFFLVVQRIRNKQEMLQLVNRIQSGFVQNQDQVIYSIQLKLTVGVALFPTDGRLFTELYKKSKIALLHAKKFSRGKCFFYSKEIMEAFEHKVRMQKALTNCLINEEIQVYYQPIYNLTTRKIRGFEALMRWQSSEFGMVSPVEFIPYAEENMMILEMGLWIIEKSIQDIITLNQDYQEAFTININVSAIQLRSSKFIKYLESLIYKYSIYPGLIELEITENVLIESMKNGVEILDRLKELGVTIALDDFGTGYSSISYLQQLPIDVLKIDRSFIKEIHDEKEVAIIKSIVEMASQYKREIIAEGVETRKQFELVKEMGCGFGQGYLFAQPMPIEELKHFIEQYN